MTNTQKTQKTAHMSDADYLDVFQATPGPYLLLLPDAPRYTIVTANDAYTASTLTNLEDLVGQGVFEAFPDNPDDKISNGVAKLRASLDHVVTSRKSDKMKMQKYDVPRSEKLGGGFEEKYWEPQNTPVLDENGNIRFIIHNVADVTDRIKMNNALRDSEQFSKSIIDSSPDCIKVLDYEGRLLSMNEEGCKQMEVDDVSICLMQDWVGFWKEDSHGLAKEALEEAQKGNTARFEGLCATMKGVPKWWEVIVTPIHGENDKAKKLLCISRDITSRKKLEAATYEAQKSAESANMAKTEFLANMSHEIRTPMNAVIGLSNILSQSQGLTLKQKDYVRTLQLSADSLLGLINDLLDISKIEARSIELEHIPFDLSQMLNEVISMMSMRAKEKGLDFEAEGLIEKNHILLGDPMRLRQIILNLCSNAIKFTEKGGVYISVKCAPSAKKNIEMVSITVRDTGIGIALDKQDTIFEKFIQADSSFNRKFGGTGLGLAITKTLTEVMGGTISLQSKLDVGSTFTVILPMMLGDKDAELEPVHYEPVKNQSLAEPEHNVLLVEDYPGNALVAGTFLEDFGYDHDLAVNGFEAIEKAASGKYLAILMDVQMPGINGFEATKIIRAYEKKNNLPRVPIIGMTAHAMSGDRERCISADMDDYISKPFDPKELKSKLSRCVEDLHAK